MSKKLVVIENNQPVTTSQTNVAQRVNDVLKIAKETYAARATLEENNIETNLNHMAFYLKDIAEAFYQFEDCIEGISVTLRAFEEITHYMTPTEFSAFHVLLNMARDGIITGFLCPHMKKTKNNDRTVYILLMQNQTVKIGVATDVQSRLSTITHNSGMQVLNWCRSAYLCSEEAFKVEHACHEALKSKRLEGEFFNCSYESACAELQKHTNIVERH